MPETREMTLGSMLEGAAEELFAAALAKVLDNIEDPNTDPNAKRVVQFTVAFKPDDDRRAVKVALDCITKLATMRPVSNTIFVGRHEGRLIAVEALNQTEMFNAPQGRPQAVETERSA